MVGKKSKKFEQLLRLQEEMLELQHEGSAMFAPVVSELPQVDMYETDGELHIKMYIPEFEKDEIELGSNDHILDIRAEKKTKNNIDRRYLIKESRSIYTRKLGLPDGAKIRDIRASYENNILLLSMPYNSSILNKIHIS